LWFIPCLKKEIKPFWRYLKKTSVHKEKQGSGHQELPANNALFKEGTILKQLESLWTEISKMAQHLKWLKDVDICRLLKIQGRTQETDEKESDRSARTGFVFKSHGGCLH
jgi:hypothetical protein